MATPHIIDPETITMLGGLPCMLMNSKLSIKSSWSGSLGWKPWCLQRIYNLLHSQHFKRFLCWYPRNNHLWGLLIDHSFNHGGPPSLQIYQLLMPEHTLWLILPDQSLRLPARTSHPVADLWFLTSDQCPVNYQQASSSGCSAATKTQ